jgi:C4-dicarboxylate-binding protein DctP
MTIRKTRTKLLVGALAVGSLTLAGCGGARGGGDAAGGGDEGKTYTLKFSHVVTDKTPKGQAAEKFKELLEEKSEGKIKVEVYPNSELYGDKDELQALQSNSVQMLAPAGAKFSTVAPQLQVLDLPFLFDTVEDIPEVMSKDSKLGKAIYENEKLAAKDIKVMGLWDNGLKQFHANTELRKPEDLKGVSFRIQSSDVLKSQIEAWGGKATPMAFSEVYNALQQGVVDGGENPYSNIESQKFHTVQKHITESGHGYVGYILVVNNTWFNELPEDLQKAVEESADEASDYNREIASDLNEEAKGKIEKAGTTKITVLTDEERQAFKDVVVPSVWEQYKSVIGAEIVDELLSKQKK